MAEPNGRASVPEPREREEPTPQERAVLAAWRQGLLEPRPRHSLGAIVLRLVGGLLALALLAGVLLVVVILFELLTTATGLGGGLERQASQVAERVSRTAAGAVQSAQDLADPAHPPREPLAFDTEFSALVVYGVGDQIAATSENVLTLSAVRRRADVEDPRLGAYAMVQKTYRQPRERRVLGVLIGTDTGAQDFYLYAGESFRVGRTLYKVNWVSYGDQRLAVATYRRPDVYTGPLKLELD